MASLTLPKIFIDLQIPLMYLTNALALAIGPRHQVLRLGITLPLFSLLALQSLYRDWSGGWGLHYALEVNVCTQMFIYFDWNILGSPDRERWRKIRYDAEEPAVNGNGHIKKKEDGVPQSFLQRAWWALRLLTGNRYVGWTQEVKNVPKEVSPEYPRLLFILRKSLRVAFFHVLREFMYSYTAGSPYGAWSDIVHLKPISTLSTQPFWTRFWWSWVGIVLTYSAMEEANAAYGVLSVATGLANPRDCPSAFGDLRNLMSLRKAWSTVWHQHCRRICSAPGIFIARDVLRLRRGSFASKYFQLFIGFGISAIVHGCASMFVHRSLEDDGAFACFIGQAAIIMVEDHVIDFGKRLGFKDSIFWRLVGFAWTVFAIGASFTGWTSCVVDHGMWFHDRTRDIFGVGPQIVA
ncbi:hypothetical protein HBH56_149490 [Parastagonospora nodorum]|uniref:Wax synthase domain-containing protein n=1 Tax=Phaeosphaeria nodorum (strain SN15 / ATCC MYA-4574 / FGSC 10173) TaxID=321614 RepID=A0A7U2EYE0_PHANO|nr:hypothetical protein HBH56_149490 [Parastagonospora nodorum]QRC94188.1 hypothetical protein JI435_074590 [Parastagonospora nodorum SN15]KAH3928384.1 hypothetical protein HBH54_135390 [Parastagonospora nodorum]KAH3946086.1 hypothetical protein HBH53_136940 [Parastagonospora nodorum]KAH3984168.1 hypothetical protein HBH52_063070 [Parastagonospora nodorum]